MSRHYLLVPMVKNAVWLLLGASIVGLLLFSQASGQPVSAAPAAAPVWTTCTPTEVMAFPERIHVRCAAAVGGVSFFAVSTGNASNAARMLSMLTTAQVAGRALTIRYDPNDLSGSAIGCLTNDCRLIIAVGFGQ